jgi:hypothetical protein
LKAQHDPRTDYFRHTGDFGFCRYAAEAERFPEDDSADDSADQARAEDQQD